MMHDKKIQDNEPHFIIDPLTRTITNSSSGNNIIVQYDHNSERFTFELPRYVDGHDMSESDEVRVHYVNSASTKLNNSSGVYICDDLAISDEDENKVTFSWLLSSAATQYIGFLHFSIQFVCLDDEMIEYAWNTGVYKDIVIIESINNADVIVEPYPDILRQWKAEVKSYVETTIGGIENRLLEVEKVCGLAIIRDRSYTIYNPYTRQTCYQNNDGVYTLTMDYDATWTYRIDFDWDDGGEHAPSRVKVVSVDGETEDGYDNGQGVYVGQEFDVSDCEEYAEFDISTNDGSNFDIGVVLIY